ncbi:MAG: hypothetical protein ACREEC_08405 [Thermoplasmata archaeon]
MTENRRPLTDPSTTGDRAPGAPGEPSWPLPKESRGVNEGLAWSALAGNSSLGIVALGIGAGAFRHRYPSSRS